MKNRRRCAPRSASAATRLTAATFNRAIDMAIRAIEYRIAQSPHPDGDEHIEACANCGSGEYLTNWDGNRNDYCGQCGQKIDWREEDDDNAEKPDL